MLFLFSEEEMIKISISVSFFVLCVWCSIYTATPVPVPKANPEAFPNFDDVDFDDIFGVGYGGNGLRYNGYNGASGSGTGASSSSSSNGGGGSLYGTFNRYRNQHFYPPIAVLAG